MDTRAGKIFLLLEKHYPRAKIALSYKNPLELLVATILSAQCTDKTVNTVTPALFKKYRKPQDYIKADPKELENDIRKTGFYRNKAKNIRGTMERIVSAYNGTVPDTMQELVTLPGVARKTANVVLQNGFNKTEGVVVDTHVLRLSFRLGFTKKKDAVKVENDLMKIFPKENWPRLSDLLISHGRTLCRARNPRCDNCFLLELCPRNGM